MTALVCNTRARPMIDHETKVAGVKVAAMAAGAGTAMSLSDVAAIAGICTSLAVFVYTVVQLYVLVRDRIIRDRAPAA